MRTVWAALPCLLAIPLLGGDYGAAVLNESIHPIRIVELAYPLKARLGHVEGVVVVSLKLSSDGGVKEAAAVSGPRLLISDCLENAKKWRFQPGTADRAVLIYRFHFEGTCLQPCQSQFLFSPPNLASIRVGEPLIDH